MYNKILLAKEKNIGLFLFDDNGYCQFVVGEIPSEYMDRRIGDLVGCWFSGDYYGNSLENAIDGLIKRAAKEAR